MVSNPHLSTGMQTTFISFTLVPEDRINSFMCLVLVLARQTLLLSDECEGLGVCFSLLTNIIDKECFSLSSALVRFES